jgi:propanediol dehydratase small subunit
MKYPLYREARESLELPSGRPVGHFSLENLEAGRLSPEDLGIHEQTLRRQARIAREAGFAPLARNLERAAEMTRLPAAKILEIYEALRRGERSAELETLAGEIEQAYDAVLTAEFIREAAGLHHPGR